MRSSVPRRWSARVVFGSAIYRSLEVRGTVSSVTDDPGGAFLASLAQRYGRPLPPMSSLQDRVILTVRPLSSATTGPAAQPPGPA
jgi:hypothetical protein